MFLLSLCASGGGTAVFASPAYPGWINFRHPDGSVVKIKLIGDEYSHYAMSEDGYSLLYDADGYWTYARQDGAGNMVASHVKAVDVAGRSAETKALLKTLPKALGYGPSQLQAVRDARLARATGARRALARTASRASVTGDKKILVILVDFPDLPFSKTNADFRRLMNEEGYGDDGARGSVADYYREASHGQLRLMAQVAGPYRASHPYAYYGRGQDYQTKELVKEAVAAADGEVDFAEYDEDKDGVADNVHIIFAGHGEEAGAGEDHIWSHRSWTTVATADGVSIGGYSCSPELRGSSGPYITHIGVICHELGHAFGCWDFYDTDYGSGGLFQGTGQWDVMGSGNWNANGAAPAHFNPYVACYDFGWAVPETLETPSECSLLKNENKVYRIDTRDGNEYFLLENRQQEGFDASLPGHGLMIYRVHCGEDGEPVHSLSNSINTQAPQNMYPVCAGSAYAMPGRPAYTYGEINSPQCPFPGTSGNTDFSDESTPSSKSFSGICTEKPVTDITENNGNISFVFNGGTGNVTGFKVAARTENSMTLKWQPHPDSRNLMLVGGGQPIDTKPLDKPYKPGDLLPDNQTKVLYVGDASEFIHAGLTNNRMYYYRIYARPDDASSWSTGVSASGKTEAGVISQYPYEEDFKEFIWKKQVETGSFSWGMGLGYKNPFATPGDVSGVALWAVTDDGFSLHAAMAVSPVFDLSRTQVAMLSFDYCLSQGEELQLYYRTAPNEEWIQFASMADTVMWKQACLPVPARSSSLEIGFLAIHDYHYSSGFKGDEAFIVIDNVRLDADFTALPVTQKALCVHSNNITVPLQVYPGTEEILGHGVEYRQNGAWTQVPAHGEKELSIGGLQPDAFCEYRAYAHTASGITYGHVYSCMTLRQRKGDGTYENPYLIETEDDLRQLSADVWNGTDFQRCHFRLADDIVMTGTVEKAGGFTDTSYHLPMAVFNGVFDGNNKTISRFRVTVSNYKGEEAASGLFGCIGKYGVVKNLTIETDGLYGTSDNRVNFIGIVSACNYGTIIDCHTKGNGIAYSAANIIKVCGGMAAVNHGRILSCTNAAGISGRSGHMGGLVGTNYGLIKGCVNHGALLNTGSGEVGGIAGYSTSEEKKDHPSCIVIEDCVNYGAIRVEDDFGTAQAGGIIGRNVGRVAHCINFGDVTSNSADNTGSIGGIVGMNTSYLNVDRQIDGCINIGNLSYNKTGDGNNRKAYAGGICGNTDETVFSHCYNIGRVNASASTIVRSPLVAAPESGYNNVTCSFYLQGCCDAVCTDGTEVSKEKLSALWAQFNSTLEFPVLMDGFDINTISKYIPSTYIVCYRPMYYKTFSVSLPIATKGIEGEYYLEYKPKLGDHPLQRIALNGNDGYELYDLEGLQPATVYLYRFSADGYVSEWRELATTFEGSGTENNPFIIDSANRLYALAHLVNNRVNEYRYRYFKQTAAIDLQTDSLHPWIPVSPFYGAYDGGNYGITGLYVDNSHIYAGLFGYVDVYRDSKQRGGLGFKNIRLVGHNVVNAPHAKYAGGICGYLSSLYTVASQCSFNGSVKGGLYTGGLFGSLDTGLKESYAVCDLSGTTYCGGITGCKSADAIKNCYAVVMSHSHEVGGIVGYDGAWAGYGIENVHFRQGDRVKANIGTGQTDEFMKSESFVDVLNGYVWKKDDTDFPQNYGYPVLRSVASASVFTYGAEVVDDKACLHGTFVPGEANAVRKGFEWREKVIDSAMKYQETLCTPSSSLTDMSAVLLDLHDDRYYSYRAFADLPDGKGRVYGDERVFYCDNSHSNVILDKNELQMSIASSDCLTATVLPENASGKSLIWSSDDDNIVSVDGNGVIKARFIGTTFVRVRIMNTSVADSCKVTVSLPSGVEEEAVLPTVRLQIKNRVVNVESDLPILHGSFFTLEGVLMGECKNVSSWCIPSPAEGIYIISVETAGGAFIRKIVME